MQPVAQRLALLSCVVLAACGGSSPPTDRIYDFSGRDFTGVIDTDLGTTDDANVRGTDDMGPEPDLLVPVTDPPIVTVESPDLTMDVSGNILHLSVVVTSPATPQRPISSVTATIGGGTPAVLTPNAGKWTAAIDITAAPAMGAKVEVIAIDSSGAVGKNAAATLLHDKGPAVTFEQPTSNTARGSVNVRVTVDDKLYPTFAATDLTATFREGAFTLAAVPGSNPPQFDGTITFSNYVPAPTGDCLITVVAKNANGTTGIATKTITVDNTGPVITIITPQNGTFVGGLTTVTATVKDVPSGVNDATVKAQFLAAQTFEVLLVPDGTVPNQYTGVFDVHKLGTNYVLPNVIVSADDMLGNHKETSVTVKIDNTPPYLSLDPPKMRVAMNTVNGWQCSVLFDPVGDESIDDGFNPSVPQQVITVKARVEDRPNVASGQTVTYISGIDQATVRLVAMPAPVGSNPVLAVDIDGDGTCDDVNPLLTQVVSGGMTASQYIQINLAPLTSVGNPNYYDPVEPVAAGCNLMGDPTATQPPQPLCSSAGTQLTYALQYADPGTPAIWSIPPIENNNTGCIGLQFDTLNRLPEGPACLAVAASDKGGNVSISAPLRMCVRRSSMSGHPCDTFTPPNCTGTYSQATQQTTSTACTPRKFAASGEVRYLVP